MARPSGTGYLVKTGSIFSTLRARRTGHGPRARARLGGCAPRLIPRRSIPAAARSARRPRSENAPPGVKNKILLCNTYKYAKPRITLISNGSHRDRGFAWRLEARGRGRRKRWRCSPGGRRKNSDAKGKRWQREEIKTKYESICPT